MADPLVSVVIPTFYRNERLAAAIESVENQTYENVETIVVDGSEGDRHAESVATEYGIKYVAPAEDKGAHAARSIGAQQARGEYVNFLDDDDRLAPTKLDQQVPVAEQQDEVGVVYCGIRWENGHPVLPDSDVRGNVLEYALMFQMTPGSPSTMLIDAEVLDGLLPLEHRHGADDMGMKIELAKRTEFDFVDEPLVVKGDAEESLGGSQENIEGRMRLFEEYKDLYDQHPPHVRRTALGYTYLLNAELTLNRHMWSPAAIRDAARACYYIPEWPLSFVGYFFASLLGRPGRNLGWRVYWRFFLGDSHRGKIT